MTTTTKTPATGGTLIEALAKAQRKVRPVLKAEKNEHHRFKYASADAVMEAAREALHAAGLTLEAYEQEVLQAGPLVLLVMSFRLLHPASGEAREYPRWQLPACESKGRPIDKAVLGAMTELRGYFLQHLLLVSRADSLDVSGRADREDRPVLRARGADRRPDVQRRPQPSPSVNQVASAKAAAAAGQPARKGGPTFAAAVQLLGELESEGDETVAKLHAQLYGNKPPEVLSKVEVLGLAELVGRALADRGDAKRVPWTVVDAEAETAWEVAR